MRSKNLWTIIGILVLLFIGIGDTVLPGSLGKASKNTRQSINQFIVGLFPDKEFTNPNERTEKAVEEVDNKR
ncbi:MAG: hypothetical protein SAL07_13425 [Oscillatoria sp. PMC 1051.18]|uniref:hypothetical protein n=1 Tax=Oscillatoria salina TaxID=331517 RepID=UPI0013BB6A6F|nr:hypothetical protein [Oscillatoria salina]MBZ8182268.1 hypothetical protein [Oscillatoria salina IIICB1]MEC4894447.1 hypothetical protein [Oscillatoria sp. PMC 1050.18]MEC5030893.1 hypothetical protein [Oscillatoria sp. PMC 1051.18]NET91042.1 hypothetical protein [Kamptonema sp. SIO1D9]